MLLFIHILDKITIYMYQLQRGFRKGILLPLFHRTHCLDYGHLPQLEQCQLWAMKNNSFLLYCSLLLHNKKHVLPLRSLKEGTRL
jgi:hypothetical protein